MLDPETKLLCHLLIRTILNKSLGVVSGREYLNFKLFSKLTSTPSVPTFDRSVALCPACGKLIVSTSTHLNSFIFSCGSCCGKFPANPFQHSFGLSYSLYRPEVQSYLYEIILSDPYGKLT